MPAPEEKLVELLQVKAWVQLARFTALDPDFPVLDKPWENISERVLIIAPNGETHDALIRLYLAHINTDDLSRRSRIIAVLLDSDDKPFPIGLVPVGSKVMGPAYIGEALKKD